MSVSSPSLHPGDDLRHYRIERQIGAGGMGIVYEARHSTLDYRVAIKEFAIPSPKNEADTQARKVHQAALDAFIAEARVLITLDHDEIPAGGADIPKVYDLFQESGSWFLVMEYISGETLDAILEERGAPIAVEDGVRWGDSILRTLTFLHNQTPPIIHRDIKPGNLKLNEQGRVFILDFGVAKSGSAIAREQHTSSTSQFVSFFYAPPEQLRGRGTDARSDFFALGGTLYHLLTGERPPDAQERVNTTLLDRQADPLRLASEINPAIPRHVAEALQEALAIKPDQRFTIAEDFRLALADPWGQAADYREGLGNSATQGNTTAVVRNTPTGALGTAPFKPHDPSEPTGDIVYRAPAAAVAAEARGSALTRMAGVLVLILLMVGGVGWWQGWFSGMAATGGDERVVPTEVVVIGLNANEATRTPPPTFTPNGLPTAVSGISAEASSVDVGPTSTRFPTNTPEATATATITPTLKDTPTHTSTPLPPTETATPRPVKPTVTASPPVATPTTAAPFATDTPVPPSATPTTAAPVATDTPLPPPATATPPPSPQRPPIVVRDTPAWWQIGVNDLITITWDDGGGGPIASNEGAFIRVYQNGVFQRNIEIPYIQWNSQNFFPFRGSQVSGGTDQFGRFTVYVELVDVNGYSLTRSQSWDFEVGP